MTPFRKIKGHELASCFRWRGAYISRLFEGGCFATTISQSHDAAALWRLSREFRDGNEMTASYADDLEDAVKTAVEMARTRDVMQTVDEAVATEPLQGRIATCRSIARPTPPEVEEWIWPTTSSSRAPHGRPMCRAARVRLVAVCRQSISNSWLGNLKKCLAHLV